MAPSSATKTAAPHQGPKGHTLLGSLRDFNRDQLGFYARCARDYGDVVPVRLGPFPGLLIYQSAETTPWTPASERSAPSEAQSGTKE